MIKRGFTLVEVLVVLAIVALISSVILASLPSSRGVLSLDRELGELSLSLRKAQTYSIAVRKFQEGDFTAPVASCNNELFLSNYPAYGVSVQNNLSDYVLFGDPNCTDLYNDFSEQEEMIEKVSFENNIAVKDICRDIDASPVCGYERIDIAYVRPGPRVVISLFPSVSGLPESTHPTSARIDLETQDGAFIKSVIVRDSGQISTQ